MSLTYQWWHDNEIDDKFENILLFYITIKKKILFIKNINKLTNETLINKGV